MRALRVCLVLVVAACTTAPHRTAPIFTMQSNLWVNLHHWLRASARGMPQATPLAAEEQRVWDAAVAYYKKHYANRDLLFDDGMVAIKNVLRHVPNDATPPEFADDPELREILISAAPIYRATWWPEHDRMNQAWIDAVTPLVQQHGERLSRRIAAAYGETWPAQPIDVDLAVQAGPVGAYTTLEPHITISPESASRQGLASLEILFHESSHQWGRRLQTTIDAATAAHNKKVPPQLWHAVLFYNAGELTRRTLEEDGVPGYTEYAVKEGVYTRMCGDDCRARVAAAWDPHLAGRMSLEAALTKLVEEWP